MTVRTFLELGIVLAPTALLLSWAYGRFRAAGVALACIATVAIAVPVILRFRSGEVPVVMDVAIVIIPAAGAAVAVYLAGRRGNAFFPRALWGMLFGGITYFLGGLLTYIGWLYVS